MEVVKYEMDVPKEGFEVINFINEILEKVMAKAELAEYAELIGKASVAVDGISKVAEEIKSENRDELAGYMVHKLMGTLLAPKPE